jgi:hypothetical protein
MSYRGETTLKHPRLENSVEVGVNALHNEPHQVAMFGGVATLTFYTGHASIQCYATKEALTEYAEILLAAAEALAQAEREQMAVAA